MKMPGSCHLYCEALPLMASAKGIQIPVKVEAISCSHKNCRVFVKPAQENAARPGLYF